MRAVLLLLALLLYEAPAWACAVFPFRTPAHAQCLADVRVAFGLGSQRQEAAADLVTVTKSDESHDACLRLKKEMEAARRRFDSASRQENLPCVHYRGQVRCDIVKP